MSLAEIINDQVNKLIYVWHTIYQMWEYDPIIVYAIWAAGLVCGMLLNWFISTALKESTRDYSRGFTTGHRQGFRDATQAHAKTTHK